MSHPQVPLGEVADFVNGAAFKPEDWGLDGLPIIRIQNLTDSAKPFNYTERVVPEKLIVNPGDLLVSWSATLGIFQWNGPKALLNQHIFRVLPNYGIVDKNYLKYALEQAIDDMERHLHGATMKHINRKEFLGTRIPLPPLKEQRRIAAILDKASSVMKHTDTRLQTFKTFESSLFNHFFGRAREQQTRWDCIPFGELCHRLTVGVVVKPASYYRETGIPALRSLNVRPGSIEQSNFVYISEEDNNNTLAKSKLLAGDLVFVRSGRPGTCAVIPQVLDGCNAIDLLLATSDTSKIMPEFAASYFNSIAGKALVSSESKGQVQQHFNAGSLKTSLIPVPPIELQEEFCKALSKTKALLSNHKVSLQRLEDIFRSLQQTLLLG